MQQHLVEDAAQHIAVAGGGGGLFHRLADGAAQGTGGAGMLGQDAAAHLGLHRRGGRHRGTVDPHDLPAEGLLLIGALDHIDLAVQAQIGAGHGEGGAPLTGSRLGGRRIIKKLFGVVGLGDGAVELVAAGGVVALEFIVDPGGGLEFFLQAVGPDQGGRSIHFVEIPDFIRDGNFPGIVVQFLADELITEDGAQILVAHGLAGGRVEQRGGLVLHVRPDVVPGAGQFLFGQVDLVRDVCRGHDFGSFLCAVRDQNKKAFVPQGMCKNTLWDKSLATSAVPPKLTRGFLAHSLDVPTHTVPCNGGIPSVPTGEIPVRSALGSPFGKGLSAALSPARGSLGEKDPCVLLCVIGLGFNTLSC